MGYKSQLFFILLLGALTAACGGGNSSSGGDPGMVVTPDPVPVPDPVPTTTPGEFALDCIDNDSVEVRLNGTALMQNLCGYAINVGQMNSRFPGLPPITEIPPGQIVAVKLADDQTDIGYGACRAPSIPQATEPGFFVCSDVAVQGKELIQSKLQNQTRTSRASY